MARTVCRKLNCAYEESSEGIGLERGGNLIAGVLYENWNSRSIVCHIFIDGRLTPEYLYAIFHYPFEYLAVEKIICPVAATNAQSIRLVEKMGFLREAVITDAHTEGDLYLFTMRRDCCRFIRKRKRYGQKFLPSPGP